MGGGKTAHIKKGKENEKHNNYDRDYRACGAWCMVVDNSGWQAFYTYGRSVRKGEQMKEYQKRAKAKYRAKVEELRVELYPTDEDIKNRIAERVNAGEPKSTYIKRLIRQDINKGEV